LKWTAIVLGAFLVLFVAGRIAAAAFPGAVRHDGQIPPLPFFLFAVGGAGVAFVVATILGPAFARENDGHLDIAFTKPVTRVALGAATIGVDAAGIAVAFVIGAIFTWLTTLLFVGPQVIFSPGDLLSMASGIVVPVSWYVLINASTASMRRGYGAVMGLAWPAALILPAFRFIHSDNALLTVLKTASAAIAVIDPITYMHFNSSDLGPNGQVVTGPILTSLLAGLALIAGYGVLALVQWNRVES
jgi:hypothetical protein